ncbi:MAG: hypothetical protein ACR2QK_03970 [Acidimicrobiales bacterium]
MKELYAAEDPNGSERSLGGPEAVAAGVTDDDRVLADTCDRPIDLRPLTDGIELLDRLDSVLAEYATRLRKVPASGR